ncbi:Uncharacterized membrane protein [Prevotella sp. ne3005]|uniref:DUF975 family protein n=1 Tax=Prevotella sp. ne3005 TaxID=1761887 RepID=UPI0008D465F6|nr:DUF975 family protein [Prevotella sp. ne3005]SEN11413.1 Uncharacterized membrane protein [Prevotella sp. ne3005]
MGINQTYKERALASLEGKWGSAAIATLIIAIITGGISTVITLPMGSDTVAGLSTNGIWSLLCLPLEWGFTVYFLNLIRQEDIRYERLFEGYKDFIRTFLMEFLYCLAVAVGTCLFIVPGIILGIGLCMAPYILKDDPQISAMDALMKSWQITRGHKLKLFWLGLSFIGWIILSFCTFGLGFFLLAPYMEATFAHYYEDIKTA